MSKDKLHSVSSQSFEVRSCDLQQVVVFQDRAELTRLLKCDVSPGENEILLTKFPEVFDKDSLRVVIHSTCRAVLNEVSYQETYVSKEEIEKMNQEQEREKSTQELAKLKLISEKKELEEKIQILDQNRNVVTQKIELLDKYLQNVTSPDTLHKMNLRDFLAQFKDPGEEGSASNIITNLLDFYEEQMMKEEVKRIDIEWETKELKRSLASIEKKINESVAGASDTSKDINLQKQAGVYIDADSVGSVEIKYSYLVKNASWTPKYDLRVDNVSLTLSVFYFGMIKQSSGEDWMNVKIILSTAAANVSGEIPELETKYITSAMLHAKSNAVSNKRKKRTQTQVQRNRLSKALKDQEYSSSSEEDSASIDSQPMRLPQAETTHGILSNTFHIASLASIPSDNTPHKVSVAKIDLKPVFEHVTVPKKAPCAFLKARVKNVSKYMFLPGPSNVFLDNNFVTKSTINSVAPNEEFETYLGVDNRVKIDYKPLKKFREQVGIFSKSVVWNFQQDIQVESYRQDEIKVQVTDQVPNSLDSSIIIKIQQPNVQPLPNPPPDPLPNPHMDRDGLIMWDITVKPGKTEAIRLQYTVEYPKNIQVTGLNV